MNKSNGVRILSLLLAMILVLGMLPVSAFAQGTEPLSSEGEMPEEAVSADPLDEPSSGLPDESSQPEEPEEDGAQEPSQAPAATPAADLQASEQASVQTGAALQAEVEPIAAYSDFITSLEQLEQYARDYVSQHPEEESVALVINYIRCGVEKYTSGTWKTFCGEEKTAFTSYVAQQDAANGTGAGRLRSLEIFQLPNGDEAEFAHMFGCLDMAYHTGNQNTADLGSWAGDICDLLQLTTNAGVTGTVEEMAEEIRTNTDRYFLHDEPDAHSFGVRDLYADLDSFYILKKLDGSASISSIMKNYFTANLTDEIRVSFFLKNRFDGLETKADIRSAVYETYCANEGIRTLEGTYIDSGVNGDLRTACCYAFADYLYETVKDQLENSYFKVFSTSTSMLAPGVTQVIKQATARDNKQLVYYLAIADVSRDDVSVHANYNNNDGSAWAMARVSDQMAAAQKRHSDPNSPAYVENYNVVAGVNADFYNMSNGAPSGPLVMEGVEYHGMGSGTFFGVLKDGTPIIGGKAEWNANRENIQEAVGASITLVKDGKLAVTASSNYYNDRASRTCVGITYDGRVVLMVLDGRQEPFSAGGSAIEIAQIMLEAGCVTAVNLDGGGSTTYAAKGEGSETIQVINRPSDGYERSVSSSLMIVSTAKPSNTFDHAVVSAGYDYLTVGTELAIKTRGVTVTGGAAQLPEDAVLQLSDDSIGELSEENVFTAKALGTVQVQLIDSDGTVLGSKTLNVVEPTDLKFTKSSINAVYGESVELPVEASYHGNLVKVNPGDVTFGFLKISLQSIGNLEGGSLNITKQELVFEYPEAGTIQDFSFTANPAGKLRTLNMGGILTNKLDEFQAVINEEFQRVFQEALVDGYTQQDAMAYAQSAAVGQAMKLAAQLKIFFYSDDEANFDFNEKTGGSNLIAWRREVSNSSYRDLNNTYYQNDPSADMEVGYTFAVDMSKVAIPEKLTALLYMLPGGDQEGRTAWDFLLQLAERVSPLTTVTITADLPEGFSADLSNLRLANEYFALKSAEVKNGRLVVICNFIEQSEPINPTSANPLCVLSGLKLIPEDSVWDENSQASCVLNGTLSYDIYAHFHVLESLAQQEEYQQKYGLYPYNNTANIPGDSGAHFFNDADSFEDSFNLQKNNKNGWIKENDAWSYYQDGVALTGAHKLPSFKEGEAGEFWYDLGTDGSCTGKLTGIFAYEGNRYYSRLGELVSGWQSITDADGESYFYYFDEKDNAMYTGVRTIKGLTYTFDDEGRMTRGAFRTTSDGTKYFVAGESWFRRFVTLEEGTYWLNENGYVAYGNAHTVTTNVKDITWYHFDEETGLLTGLCSGLITYQGKPYYCDENGKVFYGAIQTDKGIVFSATQGRLYVNTSCYIDASTGMKGCELEPGKYWCDENGYIVGNGFADIEGITYYFQDYKRAKGFVKVGDDYYIFNAGNGKMYKDADMWVGANPYGVEEGIHHFEADGKMYVPNLETGIKKIVEENGKLYFTIDGVKQSNGLYELDGDYYYVQYNGALAVSQAVWVDRNAYEVVSGWRYFGEDGKLSQTGFVTGGGATYYYENGKLLKGFSKVGDDYYLFNAGSGKMYKDADMWVGANPYGVEEGIHHFEADGKMYVPNLETGIKKIVEENGKLYFTIDGVKQSNGLYELDGDYYYVQYNGALAVSQAVWVDRNAYEVVAGWRYFGEDGKLSQTGFVTGGGATYYYENGKLIKGFAKIGDSCYLFNTGSGKMYKDADMWVGANPYGVEEGIHHFEADGKMYVPNLETGIKKIVEENGKLYFTIDGVKQSNGLYELDGDYYYVQYNGALAVSQAVWVDRNAYEVVSGWRYFGEDGKLSQTGFVTGGGATYYYENGKLLKGFSKVGDDYYLFNAGSGKMYKEADMWVGANPYGVAPGMYRFGADGKMTAE